MPISYGLNLAKKGSTGTSAPAPGRRKPVFGDEDSDTEGDGEEAKATKPNGAHAITTFDVDDGAAGFPQTPASTIATKSRQQKTGLHPPKLKSSSAASLQAPSISSLRSTNQATADVDESLYDYDDFLSARNAVEKERKAASAASSTSRNGPNYMADLQAAAEQRKRDQDRARDKLLQRQREQEGDEFQDKEEFVTEAYKRNQEETRRAEEAEAKREEAERKKREAGIGMTAFHRGVMEEEDRRHREILEAAERLKEQGIEARDDDAEHEESEAELARKLREQGKKVEVNAEGEVTDKRELLSGGLNIVAKPKPAPAKSAAGDSAASRPANGAQQSGLRGNTDAKRAMRERQTRMMEAQLEQAQKRAAEEEAEEVHKRERAAKSQKSSGEISSAKERYLQRKREAAEAAARGEA